MSCAAYLHEAVLAPLGMDASLGLAPADAPRTRARLAVGALRRGRALQLRALPRATRRRRAAGSRARAPTGSCSPACSPAAPPSGGALLARGDGRGDARAAVRAAAGRRRTAWASGPTSAGASASTCAGSASRTGRATSLSPRAASHFGASGTLAWLDPERGLGLVALANRGSYSGWWREPWAALGAAVTAAAAAA